MIKIPLIKDDQTLIEVLDELKYALKQGNSNQTDFQKEFNSLLNSFISEWSLNKDEHIFVCGIPKKIHTV